MNMRVYKPLLFAACLSPVIWLVLRITGVVEPGLGANPAEEIQDELGVWALRLLLATLCVHAGGAPAEEAAALPFPPDAGAFCLLLLHAAPRWRISCWTCSWILPTWVRTCSREPSSLWAWGRCCC